MADARGPAPRIGGVLVPAVSTFDTWQGALTADRFQANVRAHVAAGVAGVVVADSAGEAVLLTEEERVRLTRWAREAVPADRWLVVGTGSESTALTIQRTQAARINGADAVLVLPPSYYGASMTRAAMAEHFWRVVDEADCRVVLSNAPHHTHVSIGLELVHALSAHENVVGVVDASGDLRRLRGYLSAQSATFSVLSAHGATFADALAAGARGGVLAEAAFAPAFALTVHRAMVRRDHESVGDAQARLVALSEVVASLGPAGVKAALDAVGLYGGPVRAPLGALSASQLAEVEACLRDTGAVAPAER